MKKSVKNTKAMMTMTEQQATKPAPSKAKGANGKSSKVISTGLAVATGIGMVGLIGVRAAQEANANTTQVDSSTASTADGTSVVVSSDGYTKEQLDAYALALSEEAIRLTDYRNQLNALVAEMSGQPVNTQKTTPQKSRPAAGKPAVSKPAVNKPAAKPAPAIAAPQPQSKSQGS